MTYRLTVTALLTVLATALHATAEVEAPLQRGVGVTYYTQQQDYDITGGTLSLGGMPVPLSMLPSVDIESDLSEINIKGDVWVLPFLNLFGMLGYVDGETQVKAFIPAALAASLGPAGAALAGPLELDIEYEGYVYGGGATLAGAWDMLFGSLTATYTWIDLDVSSSSISSWVLTPKLGINVEDVGSLDRITGWAGGMYERVDETQEGVVTLGMLGRVDYDVELEEKDPWNWLVGIGVGIREDWTLELEAGFGGRQHAVATATYRF